MLAVFLFFLVGVFYLGDLIDFYSFGYHFSVHELQTAIFISDLSLEPQTFIFYCPVGISTRCPEQ